MVAGQASTCQLAGTTAITFVSFESPHVDSSSTQRLPLPCSLANNDKPSILDASSSSKSQVKA